MTGETKEPVEVPRPCTDGNETVRPLAVNSSAAEGIAKGNDLIRTAGLQGKALQPRMNGRNSMTVTPYNHAGGGGLYNFTRTIVRLYDHVGGGLNPMQTAIWPYNCVIGLCSLTRTTTRLYNCARRFPNLAGTTVRPCDVMRRKPIIILAVSKLRVELQVKVFDDMDGV